MTLKMVHIKKKKILRKNNESNLCVGWMKT